MTLGAGWVVLALFALPVRAEPALAEQLEALAAARVFFAHQSVGQNVVDGLSVLASRAGVTLRIEEGRGAAPFARPGFIHARAGRDGDPLGKLAAFAALLDEGPGNAAGIALLELSYADFNADTHVPALFAAFQLRHAELQARYPALKLVVVTAGLTTVGRGLQAMVRNRMASGAFGERENVKRHEFNQLLRHTYPGALLDLAAVQAGRCTFDRDGKQWPCLREELTDDGAHLNKLGRKEVARALVTALTAAQ